MLELRAKDVLTFLSHPPLFSCMSLFLQQSHPIVTCIPFVLQQCGYFLIKKGDSDRRESPGGDYRIVQEAVFSLEGG